MKCVHKTPNSQANSGKYVILISGGPPRVPSGARVVPARRVRGHGAGPGRGHRLSLVPLLRHLVPQVHHHLLRGDPVRQLGRPAPPHRHLRHDPRPHLPDRRRDRARTRRHGRALLHAGGRHHRASGTLFSSVVRIRFVAFKFESYVLCSSFCSD